MGNGELPSIENGSSIPWSEWFKREYHDKVINKWILPTTEYSLKILRGYFEQYRSYVKHNPLLISEIESALYWISYLLSSTRFTNSRIIAELLYSCSSLLTLFNDILLRHSYGLSKHPNSSVKTFHIILQFIEYIQVFVELTATQMYGFYGKWIVVSIIEIIKATIRLLSLLYFQQGLTHHHYIRPLNRQREYERYQLKRQFKNDQSRSQGAHCSSSSSSSADEAIVLNDYDSENEQELLLPNDHLNDPSIVDEHQVFKLKSSGRIIRNIDHAPPKEKRMWITPMQTIRLRQLLQKNHRTNPTITELNRQRLIGELLYIVRPVLHLATGAMTGGIENNWAPYLVSLGIDVVSLGLLRGNNFQKYRLDGNNLLGLINTSCSSSNEQQVVVDNIWNWSEQIEIQRRYMALFMYLLRSPFYDQYTKQRLLRLLSLFANYIPLFGRLLRPFISNLPQWQQVYYYVWN